MGGSVLDVGKISSRYGDIALLMSSKVSSVVKSRIGYAYRVSDFDRAGKWEGTSNDMR